MNCIISIIKQMFNLKNTMETDSGANESSNYHFGFGRILHQGKNTSVCINDAESKACSQQNKRKMKKMVIDQCKKQIMSAYKKELQFNQMCLYGIIGHLHVVSENLNEIEYLSIIQDNVEEFIENGDDTYKHFVKYLLQHLNRRIQKLKKREIKNQLQEYEDLIKANFQKKNLQKVDQNDKKLQIKQKIFNNQRKNHDSESSYDSNEEVSSSNLNDVNRSTQGKFVQLFSNSKSKNELTSEEDTLNEDNINFSTIVADNTTVRQLQTMQNQKNQKVYVETHLLIDHEEKNGNNDALSFIIQSRAK